MKRMNPKVDAFIREEKDWPEETKILRTICLGCGLTEELKWGKPCYTFQETNVVVIQGFKEYCALLFCKGSLLKDSKRVLNKIGEHTQAARQIRFSDAREIVRKKAVVKAYIHEAIMAEKAGLKVAYKKNPEPIPEELQHKLDHYPDLKAAFGALTPGRQRHYILFFSAAKQSATRTSRVEKFMPRILSGKGLND
jgi:uncharacterized protein YdeI (YjbR/CyaY-like superfamily)